MPTGINGLKSLLSLNFFDLCRKIYFAKKIFILKICSRRYLSCLFFQEDLYLVYFSKKIFILFILPRYLSCLFCHKIFILFIFSRRSLSCIFPKRPWQQLNSLSPTQNFSSWQRNKNCAPSLFRGKKTFRGKKLSKVRLVQILKHPQHVPWFSFHDFYSNVKSIQV